MSMTTRAKANAVFHHPAPPRTRKRGRPRLKGDRIGTPAQIATTAQWKTTSVSRYGSTSTVHITETRGVGYGTWRTDAVRIILLREATTKSTGYDIALVTTDLHATPEQIIARYAARWSIEVTFFEVKNILGVGQARNRVRKAVERTVPFGLFCYSILTAWYTLHGHDQTDVTQRRAAAPWHRSKPNPPPWTCSPSSAARSSPPDLCQPPPDQPQPKKSSKSTKPGHWPPPEAQKSRA